MRAWAPGARIWADCGKAHHSSIVTLMRCSRTYTIFAGALCKGDIHDIVMQVPCFFFRQSREPMGRILQLNLNNDEKGQSSSTHLSNKHRSPEHSSPDNLEWTPALLPKVGKKSSAPRLLTFDLFLFIPDLINVLFRRRFALLTGFPTSGRGSSTSISQFPRRLREVGATGNSSRGKED